MLRDRNTIVFLAADKTGLQDLDEAARKFLAWESIVAEADKLDLTRQQVKRTEKKNGGRRRRDGQASRNISVAAFADAGEPAGSCHVAGNPSFRASGAFKQPPSSLYSGEQARPGQFPQR